MKTSIKLFPALALMVICISAYSQSSNVTLASKWLHGYSTFGAVYVDGNYAYCASDSILYILDVSNPSSNPSSIKGLSQIRLSDNINWIYITNSKAYIAQDDSGLCIVDISNPYLPVKMGTCAIPYKALSVKVSGNYAYVAAGTQGMRIIDISNPNAPAEVSSFSGYVLVADVSGNYAYLAAALTFIIVDISNPLNPVASGSLPTTYSFYNVFIQGNYAYTNDGEKMTILDVTIPSLPVWVSSITVENFASFHHIFVSGNYAYTFSQSDYYQIWDVSNPASPSFAGQYDANLNDPYPQSIFVTGSTVYFLSMGKNPNLLPSMDIVNVSNPSAPSLIASYQQPNNRSGFATKGHYLFSGGYAAQGGMISVFDLIDPAHPVHVGTIIDTVTNQWMDAYAMYISGNYLYISGIYAPPNAHIFKIFDISNPLNSFKVGSFTIPNASAGAMAFKGNYAYVCYTSMGLVVVDLSNPATPVQAGSILLSGGFPAYDISISGNYAYVTDNANKMHVIDITNSVSPIEVSSFVLVNEGSIYAEGNYAYVAEGAQGVQIINVSNTTAPVLAGTYTQVANALRVHKSGNFIFLSDFQNGMQVIDVSNPANPIQAGYYYDIYGYARNVYADSLHSYLATDEGIYIFNGNYVSSSGPVLDSKSKLSVYPNPVNDVLYVSLKKPSTSNTLTNITDMQGRMVGEKNTNHTNESVISIDVSGLSQGVYLLRMNGQVQRFVKM